jgi:hypothetical protein
MYGVLSDEKTGLYFAVHTIHWPGGTRNYILVSHLRLSQPGEPGHSIYVPPPEQCGLPTPPDTGYLK